MIFTTKASVFHQACTNIFCCKWFVPQYLHDRAAREKNALDFTPRWPYTPITNRILTGCDTVDSDSPIKRNSGQPETW
jgi:hypothetical protein